MTETVIYPVAPETTTVLGSRWRTTDVAWRGLAFSHEAVELRTQSTLMLYVAGRDAPYDLHLNVPFEHPDDGPIPDPPEMMYRVRPRAEVGKRWMGRRVTAVAIEPDAGRDPPWRIVVTFAGKRRR